MGFSSNLPLVVAGRPGTKPMTANVTVAREDRLRVRNQDCRVGLARSEESLL